MASDSPFCACERAGRYEATAGFSTSSLHWRKLVGVEFSGVRGTPLSRPSFLAQAMSAIPWAIASDMPKHAEPAHRISRVYDSPRPGIPEAATLGNAPPEHGGQITTGIATVPAVDMRAHLLPRSACAAGCIATLIVPGADGWLRWQRLLVPRLSVVLVVSMGGRRIRGCARRLARSSR